MAHILVIDPNEAFATLLSDELRRLRHKVTIVAHGTEAIAEARRRQPDMVLLDLAISQPGPAEVARELRQLYPNLRLMLTHFMGEAIPETFTSIIQGSLPKPFFLPDLPGQIEAALTSPVAGAGIVPDAAPQEPTTEAAPPADDLLQFLQQAAQPAGAVPESDDLLSFLQQAAQSAPPSAPEASAEPEAQPAPTTPPSEQPEVPAPSPTPMTETIHYNQGAITRRRRDIERLMDQLRQEIGATVVLLTMDNALAAWIGDVNQEAAEIVATAAWQGQRSAQAIAQLLGASDGRFEQSITGADYTLYALSVNDHAILAVAIRGSSTLGLVRHRVRRTTEDIATHLS